MKNFVGILSLTLFLLIATANRSWTQEQDGLKIPPGFRVSVYADESVANDTYAMTLDAKGRVVVTTRGVIKTLHDDGKSAKANRYTVFAKTETGGMGLCFDRNTLLYCGDGWLSRLQDANGDGQADGPSEHILPLAFTEHGGHAIRKGPDGFWYVIGGNDSGIGPRHSALPGSPVKKPEAGAILRLTPDLKGCEVIAHGFRNPYDFDFNTAGEIFTYDSDVERDIFLPWYTPTRIYHVAIGGHHGWRLTGYLRSWPRPSYDPGTVDILTNIGRGSPTGVVCYRHVQFPKHYQGGLFVLDWTFGKVYFLTLTPDGGTYKTKIEVFIEPQGTSGFAPTDAVVAPDGSLLISVGGRGTRGLVYRVEHIEGAARGFEESANSLDRVLRAHQPLDAWSRAKWEPQMEELGRQPFLQASEDNTKSVSERIRALEILTERFGGLSNEEATSLAKSNLPELRARTAWSVGRVINKTNGDVLAELLEDDDPRVRRESIDAHGSNPLTGSRLLSNLGHKDKRVRLAAVRNASSSYLERAKEIEELLHTASPQAKLCGLLAEMERTPSEAIQTTTIRKLLAVFSTIRDAELQLQTVRLIQRALGDYRLNDPAVEVLTAYSTQTDLSALGTLKGDILNALRPLFPSGNESIDDEIARLLAMLEDDDTIMASRIAEFWTRTSSATRDLHFLIVFARLRAPRTEAMTLATAHALLALDGKLSGQEQRIKQSWNTRLGEIVSMLLASDPKLGSALLVAPGFVGANHATLALAFTPMERETAARAFLKAISFDPDFAWSGPLIELLANLPAQEVAPVFRKQWMNMGLRDAMLPKLAEHPEESDRSRFLVAIDSSQPEVVRVGLSALETLSRDPTSEHLIPLVRQLRRLAMEPNEKTSRSRLVALIGRQSGESFSVKETANDAISLRKSYDPIFSWFSKKHPVLAKQSMGSIDDPAAWSARLGEVDWKDGDVSRGSALFSNRGCATCHSGARALGPDLSGVTSRLSRADLFTAIVSPSLDVAPAYRTTMIETRDGLVISGLIAFESADGLIVQTGATTTVRLATPEIVSRHISTRSLMPDQLLQGLSDQDLADLDAFLRSIPRR